MTRFIVFFKADARSEAGILPTPDELAAMDQFSEGLATAGVVRGGDGLRASSLGVRLFYEGDGKVRVVDGPFAETKELVAGYGLLETKSKEEAVAWMRGAPVVAGGSVEIRRLFEAADFAPSDPTGELRAREAELRKRT